MNLVEENGRRSEEKYDCMSYERIGERSRVESRQWSKLQRATQAVAALEATSGNSATDQ